MNILFIYRYRLYDWAVIQVLNADPIHYHMDNLNLRIPCDEPESISCGTTGKKISFLCMIFVL